MKKAGYKKVSNLSIANRAYIAGIVDGEGTITLTVKQKGGTRQLVYRYGQKLQKTFFITY